MTHPSRVVAGKVRVLVAEVEVATVRGLGGHGGHPAARLRPQRTRRVRPMVNAAPKRVKRLLSGIAGMGVELKEGVPPMLKLSAVFFSLLRTVRFSRNFLGFKIFPILGWQ